VFEQRSASRGINRWTKDKSKERLGRSPDSAVAVLLAYTNVNTYSLHGSKFWVP